MDIRRCIALIGVAVLLATAASAEQFARVGSFGAMFAQIPVDARGSAMGLATTVNPQGPTAFWWNPAPLPESNRVEVSYTSREMQADLRWRPLAVRASRGPFTFGYLWGCLSMDPLLVRTAYEPDGNGEYFDAGSDLHQFSLAADLAPRIAGGQTAWAWTLGSNARYYREHLAETSVSAWDADLGSTLAWTPIADESMSLRILGTAMVRNLFARDIAYDEVRTQLSRYYHFGLGIDMGFGTMPHGKRMVVVTISHAWRRYIEGDFPGTDNEHLGLEVLLYDHVALRRGHRDSQVFFADGWSWGVGLQHHLEDWYGLRLAVDYARTDMPDSWATTSPLDHWTFTAGIDLP